MTIGNFETLIDSSSEVNFITSLYALKLGPCIRQINDRAWKIYDSIFKMFERVLAGF